MAKKLWDVAFDVKGQVLCTEAGETLEEAVENAKLSMAEFDFGDFFDFTATVNLDNSAISVSRKEMEEADEVIGELLDLGLIHGTEDQEYIFVLVESGPDEAWFEPRTRYDAALDLARKKEDLQAMKESISYTKKLYEDKAYQNMCYEKFRSHWLESHGIGVTEIARLADMWKAEKADCSFEEYLNEQGFNGMIYPCFEEFLDCEYKDKEFISTIVGKPERRNCCEKDIH